MGSVTAVVAIRNWWLRPETVRKLRRKGMSAVVSRYQKSVEDTEAENN
jgi:hypothetical protein